LCAGKNPVIDGSHDEWLVAAPMQSGRRHDRDAPLCQRRACGPRPALQIRTTHSSQGVGECGQQAIKVWHFWCPYLRNQYSNPAFAVITQIDGTP